MSSYEIARATEKVATEARTANLIAWAANGKCYLRDVPVLQKEIRKRLGLTDSDGEFVRSSKYLPGDLVIMSITDTACLEFNGRQGVIVYGPDSEDGWLVSSGPGTVRCVDVELEMITSREERKN